MLTALCETVFQMDLLHTLLLCSHPYMQYGFNLSHKYVLLYSRIMKIKWFGTATILVEQSGSQLLFDPFFPLNKRVFQPPLEELASTENILITHGHFDHIAHIPAILRHNDGRAVVYCTQKPGEGLIAKGVETRKICEISPGDVLNIGSFTVRVLKGKHIVFDKALVIKTFFSPRVLVNFGKFIYMLKENKDYGEFGETVVYDIQSEEKRILLMGSLNLDENTDYPKGMDLLILPFQGRSDINTYAMPFIDRLQPKKVLLDHFDNSFPPISSAVNTEIFVSLMREKHPGIPVICPQPSASWIDMF